jgi:UTP--glucose-1-phosphate uridylyltransferase
MHRERALVRKAVFPVAGFGTRFLPATKACPKEMLPIVDKPLIQFAVEEAAAAGFTQMIFVTGRNKRSIEDHFDKAVELENDLAARGKSEMLAALASLMPSGLSYAYVRQSEMLGLGHAIQCARDLVGRETFAVILADDLIHSRVPAIGQLLDVFDRTGQSVLAVQQVPRSSTAQYGIVQLDARKDNLSRVRHIVEKPRPEDAPSTSAVVGRYILTPSIFDCLESLSPGAGGEIQLTDALSRLLETETLHVCEFEGQRYDCGSKVGYVLANIDYGLRHPEVAAAINEHLSALAGREPREPGHADVLQPHRADLRMPSGAQTLQRSML